MRPQTTQSGRRRRKKKKKMWKKVKRKPMAFNFEAKGTPLPEIYKKNKKYKY